MPDISRQRVFDIARGGERYVRVLAARLSAALIGVHVD
jgi:hypothetical protein